MEANPHIHYIYEALNLVTGVNQRPNSGFVETMNKIAAANPYSPLAQEYGDKGIQATKKREVVKRHLS